MASEQQGYVAPSSMVGAPFDARCSHDDDGVSVVLPSKDLKKESTFCSESTGTPDSTDAMSDSVSPAIVDDETSSGSRSKVYPFHHSNIHERCLAAYVARAFPMACLVSVVCISLVGVFRLPMLLLWTCAVLNVSMWLWLVSYALSALHATWKMRRNILAVEPPTSPTAADLIDIESSASSPVHLIVLPNYKEDESILATTLQCLLEAKGASGFRIHLAMEEREGPGALARAEKLRGRFGRCFANFSVAYHPVGLTEDSHADGSAGPEVPGKSSNLKWAVKEALQECRADGIDPERVLLTVGDADCLFHPSYFNRAGAEFAELIGTSSHPWTMWQAPQLPFRNYLASPAPSRVWGYVASVYETGGAGGLQCRGYHMTFSSFSVPLALVLKAKPWDGDVIADDHHCYLKNFFYSIYHHVQVEADRSSSSWRTGANPQVQLRPVMLPVKSTSVESDNCVKGWQARFNQASRHTQGVAELSYALLAFWRMLLTVPCGNWSCALLTKSVRAVLLPFCINMLPIIQTVPFAVCGLYWFFNGQQVPECPSEKLYRFEDPQFYFCWFAGGYNMVWPMVLPLGLVVVASYCMVETAFLLPGTVPGASDNRWHQEDSDITSFCGSRRLRLALQVALDIAVWLPVTMPIYGVVPAIMAYWNCLRRGNIFDFRSAAKGASNAPAAGVEVVGRTSADQLDDVI